VSGALGRPPIGIVPIVWNNTDVETAGPRVPAEVILDEAARLGFDGVQDGLGFPAGDALRRELGRRGLRLAEVYAALPCSRDGPGPAALELGRARLEALHQAAGEVLVVAADLSPGRVERAGRAASPGTPQLSEAGWTSFATTLETLAREAHQLGHPLAFHGHAGTFVETPAEIDRLAASTDPDLVRLCLDVGHYTIGGGDPVAALRQYGGRVIHLHLKDVAADPLARLRDGRIGGFREALDARIFTELGTGVLDLVGILGVLAERGYEGWLMVEQDTTWKPPSESAAIGRNVLGFALRMRAEGRWAA
jgi:inosose dehydratase